MSNSVLFNAYLSEIMDEAGLKAVQQFFITFSRFEFALKASITYAHQNGNNLQPNWDAFSNSIEGTFDSGKSKELQEATNYILQHPPKKQRLNNGVIIWEDRIFNGNLSDVKKLDLYIRDIRNNLFHGSKFNGNYDPDTSRDIKLLNYALVILDEWVVLEPAVADLFSQPII